MSNNLRIILFVFVGSLSCRSVKELNFIFDNKLCNLEIMKNDKFNTDKIFYLLHDSIFLDQQLRNQKCFISLIERLANNKKYTPHYICSMGSCFYGSIWVNDTSAYLFRYDLRKLMRIYNFKDSAIFLNQYYNKYVKSDSIKVSEFAKSFYLNPKTLMSIFPND